MKKLLVIILVMFSMNMVGQNVLGVDLAQEDKQLHVAGGVGVGMLSDAGMRVFFPDMKPWKRALWNVAISSGVIFGKEGYDHFSGKGVASWSDIKAGYMSVALVGWTWTLKTKKQKTVNKELIID